MVNKLYVPFSVKQEVVAFVLNNCFKENELYNTYDPMDKELFFNCKFIQTYSDFRFTVDEIGQATNLLEEYDSLCKSGELDKIIDENEQDYFRLLESVDVAIEAKIKENSFEIIFAKLGVKLLQKLDEYLSPEAIEKLSESIKNIDPKAAKNIMAAFKVVK